MVSISISKRRSKQKIGQKNKIDLIRGRTARRCGVSTAPSASRDADEDK